MGKGSSESNTTSQSSTTNADQRVAAEGSGVAIGAGAQYSPVYTNEFSQGVATAFKQIIDFSAGALSGASDLIAKALAINENTVNTAAASTDKTIAGVNQTALAAVSPGTATTGTLTSSLIPLGIIGAVIIIAINLFKKKG